MTAKLVSMWEVQECDACQSKNTNDEIFPDGWCVLVTVRNGSLVHRAFCPRCLKNGIVNQENHETVLIRKGKV